MKCAIMQPYFFPYIGYYQLLNAVDIFVLYDDVNFIKGGWINRNFILAAGNPLRITLQLSGASPNKLINEIAIGNNRKKLLKTIEQNYSKSPFFDACFPTIKDCIEFEENNLSKYLHNSFLLICDYLGIDTAIKLSSNTAKDSSLKGSAKVINIVESLDADTYINAIGGIDLYDRDFFRTHNLTLKFLKPGDVTYKQTSEPFTPNLSIIDVMMHNSRGTIGNMLSDYELV